MTPNADIRRDAGIGITEALQEIEAIIKAMRYADGRHHWVHLQQSVRFPSRVLTTIC